MSSTKTLICERSFCFILNLICHFAEKFYICYAFLSFAESLLVAVVSFSSMQFLMNYLMLPIDKFLHLVKRETSFNCNELRSTGIRTTLDALAV